MTILKVQFNSQQEQKEFQFPGLKWSLYTSNEQGNSVCFFLFETDEQANFCAEILKKQAANSAPVMSAFGVLETMSRLTRADMSANTAPDTTGPVVSRNEIILLQVFFRIPKIASFLSLSAMDKLYPKKAAYHLLKLPGLIWKIWGSKSKSNEVSGFYLFDSREHVNMRIAHVMEAFPKKPWISDLLCETFVVNQELSRRSGAPIDLPSTEMLYPN